MTVYKNIGSYDTSNVVLAHDRVVKYFKGNCNIEMTHIDYGLSLFKSSLFETYPLGSPLDLGKVCSDLANLGLLAGHEVYERFYEIGSIRGIEDFTTYIERNRNVI
jgi:MurNAc alpha-1-phosphate uridylyltransferase